jgi:outer membrane protein TolC
VRAALAVLVLLAGATATARAQETIELDATRQQAASADPRLRQLELEAGQSALRLRNIEVERRPALSLEGQAQYQSEVVQFPFRAPDGSAPPMPPKDTYDAHLGVEQPLLDATTRARADAERARLAEAQARIRTTLFALRQEVDEAFFTAALLQEREAQVALAVTDLEARLKEARLRVEEGTALPSESESIEAALLQRRQDAIKLRAGRRAALARLSELTDRTLSADDHLALPDAGARVAEARANLDQVRARPEFVQFARMRDQLEAQKRVVGAQEEPRVSAFGKAGVGRPGLNFISRDFNPYWLAGIRVQWNPFRWGTPARERELLALQQQAVQADEDAFARSLRRAVQEDLANLDQLDEAAPLDDRIVALRESIERETSVRLGERVVTAAEYVDKQTDVLEARLLRATRRVERAQAQVRFLNVLGLEVR